MCSGFKSKDLESFDPSGAATGPTEPPSRTFTFLGRSLEQSKNANFRKVLLTLAWGLSYLGSSAPSLPLGLVAPVCADRAALTGKASRGNLTQPPKRCLSCGLSAIPFISQLGALRPSSKEEEAQGHEGKKGLQVRAWRGEQNSCHKGAELQPSSSSPHSDCCRQKIT